jgi:predicted SPOUT superfamily RNA methylase MTH1
MVTKHVTVAVPASVIADTPHLREKTAKIGYIARAAAIFRVNEIVVYADNPKIKQQRELDFMEMLLTYIETPQYMRKRLFELEPDLQYAGILPPLRTPHHPTSGKLRDLKVGEYREALALSQTKAGTLVDIGSEHPALLPKKQVPVDHRVTVQITKLTDRAEVQLVDREEVPQYWGYLVSVEEKPLAKFLENRKFDLTVATSRFATPFREAAPRLGARWKKASDIAVLFGAPTRGLHEIVQDQGAKLDDLVDFVLNTVPNQGTETVRTEEALMATLAVFNVEFM